MVNVRFLRRWSTRHPHQRRHFTSHLADTRGRASPQGPTALLTLAERERAITTEQEVLQNGEPRKDGGTPVSSARDTSDIEPEEIGCGRPRTSDISPVNTKPDEHRRSVSTTHGFQIDAVDLQHSSTVVEINARHPDVRLARVNAGASGDSGEGQQKKKPLPPDTPSVLVELLVVGEEEKERTTVAETSKGGSSSASPTKGSHDAGDDCCRFADGVPDGHLQAPRGTQPVRPQTGGAGDNDPGTVRGESEVELRTTSTPDAGPVAASEVSRASTAEVAVKAQRETLAVVQRGRTELEVREQGDNDGALEFVKEDDGSDSDDDFGKAVADHFGERRRRQSQQREQQGDRRGSRHVLGEPVDCAVEVLLQYCPDRYGTRHSILWAPLGLRPPSQCFVGRKMRVDRGAVGRDARSVRASFF